MEIPSPNKVLQNAQDDDHPIPRMVSIIRDEFDVDDHKSHADTSQDEPHLIQLERQLIELRMDLANIRCSEDRRELELSQWKVALEKMPKENEELRRCQYLRESKSNAMFNEKARKIESALTKFRSERDIKDARTGDYETRFKSIDLEVSTRGITDNNSSHKKITHGIPSCASGIAFFKSFGTTSSASISNSSVNRPGNNSVHTRGIIEKSSPHKRITHGIPSCASGIAFMKGFASSGMSNNSISDCSADISDIDSDSGSVDGSPKADVALISVRSVQPPVRSSSALSTTSASVTVKNASKVSRPKVASGTIRNSFLFDSPRSSLRCSSQLKEDEWDFFAITDD